MPKSKLRVNDLPASQVFVQHMTSADVPITSTPVDGHTLALPSAGQWVVEVADSIETGTLLSTRDITIALNVTNLTSMGVAWTLWRGSGSPLVPAVATASGVGVVLTGMPTSNGRARLNAFGIVTVSAAAVLTTPISISADTGNLRPGSYLRARKYA